MANAPLPALGLLAILIGSAFQTAGEATRLGADPIAVNDNQKPAGTLSGGVLTVHLEARQGIWHPDGDDEPGVQVLAFAEEGGALLAPGPIIRVQEGTEIRASIRNRVAGKTLVVYGLYTRAAGARDSMLIAPDQAAQVRFQAGVPGTYYYWATTTGAPVARRAGEDSQLNGAFIVDPRGASPRDRVMVITAWLSRRITPGQAPPPDVAGRITINGKSWPNTERLTYTAGDSIRWRVINTSPLVHPMHLHGFYFDVNSRGNELSDSVYGEGKAARRAVTERLAPGRTTSITWIPERAGNWIFHCHDNVHLQRGKPLDGSARPKMTHAVENHALEMMAGPVMGIHVLPHPNTRSPADGGERRQLRLLVKVDPSHTEQDPAFGYVLEEAGKPTQASPALLPGPTIVLRRGEPVSITVDNQLPEPTAVHWHGIELESYYDGVAGFAGSPGRIAPAIAPGASFEARFTPPRAGTFIYHSHIDEVRQPIAGLTGALLVIDAESKYDPESDIVLLVTTPRKRADIPSVVLLNGTATPSGRAMRAGTRYRLRFINIHTSRPSMRMEVKRGDQLLEWRAIAKDGADLPAELATVGPATQQMGNGETYDFEFVPGQAGPIRITISAANGPLLAEMPIEVR